MRKPKNMTPIKLPVEQPDCCAECPLVGLIPKNWPGKPKGSKESHLCMGTWEAMSARGIRVRASQRDSHHPLRRPCDAKWEAWVKAPEQMKCVPDQAYLQFRVPYEDSLQFKIKFHK